MNVIRPSFDVKKYEKVDPNSYEFSKGFERYFEQCSKNFSDYINFYFSREGGVLSGFRFTQSGR